MQNLQSAVGVFAMLAIAWVISEDRRSVAWKQAAIGLLVTFATAVILLKVPGVTRAFAAINDAVGADRRGQPGRHLLRLRLSRRRAIAL